MSQRIFPHLPAIIIIIIIQTVSKNKRHVFGSSFKSRGELMAIGSQLENSNFSVSYLQAHGKGAVLTFEMLHENP